MQVLDVINSKMEIAQRFLRDLVVNYDQLDDTARIERANIGLGNVQSYLQIEQNLLFPLIERTGEDTDILARACRIQNQMDDVLERSVMVHVDEPDHEFYHGMERLLNLLEQAAEVDREFIFPWAKEHLTEEEQFSMLTNLQEQTAQETLGSLEWQQAMFRGRQF